MNLNRLASKTGKILADNSPAILTAVGVTGTLAVAYLAGTASFKAAEILREEQIKKDLHEINKNEPLTPREKFEATWMLYLPAASTSVLTVTSIICANRIGARRAAALATAFNLSERAITEYRNKVVEKIGENKERSIRDEIAQDRVNRAPGGDRILITDDSGQVMCHDAFSNQFFKSDMETIRKAVNDVNAQVLHHDYATVTDFYDYIGAPELEATSISGDLGWNTDKLLEADYTSTLYKDKIPCISITFATIPVRDPWRFV